MSKFTIELRPLIENIVRMIELFHKHIVVIFLLICSISISQNDTIRLINNDFLVGEIKSISRGVLTMETVYSDEDFKIEFNKLEGIIINRKCILTLTNDRIFYGKIRSETPRELTIFSKDGSSQRFHLNELIQLVEVSDVFWKRFKGGLDLGFNLTKANSNIQFTVAGNLDFTSEKWRISSNMNLLNASQDSVVDIKRTNAMLETIRILSNKWFLLADVSFLSNTEQALTGRFSPSLGLGRFIKSTNKLYFGVNIGATYNIENYEDKTLNKNSSEAFIGSSFNMYDFKDFELNTGFKFYVGISEKGRIRTDYSINIKYNLPWDFYIKGEFTINYDNQPAVIGTDLDYIFSSGFGYKFD